VASLTRTAAAEVAGRDTPLPRQNIGTLHSHAFHALDRPKMLETTEGLKAWNEWAPTTSLRVSLAQAANPEYAAMEMATLDAEGDEYLQLMGVLRQRMIPRELWPDRVRYFASKWDEFKELTGYLDFTDLIEHALDRAPTLPQSPAVFFLDEAQDLSKLEMALAAKWGAQCEQLVIVGDPDQNLYQWRGSDPEAFVHGDASSEHVLEQSYRCSAAVVQASLEWVAQIQERRDITYKPTEEAGEVSRQHFVWEDPMPLIDSIMRDLEAGKRVMVLAACGYMLRPLCSELRDRGELFYNPYRPAFTPWNPLNGSNRLLTFLRPSVEVWGDEARFWTWSDIHTWTDPMQAKGYMVRGAKSLIQSKTTKDHLGSDRGKDEASLQTVLALFEEDHHEPVFGLDVDWWATSLRHSMVKSQQYAIRAMRKHGGAALRYRSRASAPPGSQGWTGLIVGTIHSVKGGQADKVYLFPDLSSAGYWQGWQKPGAAKDAVVRQFYVGMTRARTELVLCAPSSDMAVRWK
jgi:DNA helicase-2/ATP-dependent DNA helicase PcrA